MEPTAYRHFAKPAATRRARCSCSPSTTADKQARSINQNGFTQADLTNYEIHLIGRRKARTPRVLHVRRQGQARARPLPPDNGCVRCHVDHGAFDGTFAQFYPTIRPLIPERSAGAGREGPRHPLRGSIAVRMTEPSHPLDRPLPPDVAAGESAFIQFYQKYAVFSWPWAWRRTVLFGSIGALAGISFGMSHGLFVRDVGERHHRVAGLLRGQHRAGGRGPDARGILPAPRLAAAHANAR